MNDWECDSIDPEVNLDYKEKKGSRTPVGSKNISLQTPLI